MDEKKLIKNFFDGQNPFGKENLKKWALVAIILLIIGIFAGIPFRAIILNIVMFWFLSDSLTNGFLGFFIVLFIAGVYIYNHRDKIFPKK